MRRIILLTAVLMTFGIFSLGDFCFAQEKSPVGAPETIEEAQTMGQSILSGLPGVFKVIWQEALGVWKKVFGAIGNFWQTHIWPWVEGLWEKEISSKKPAIEEELEKEKKEMKEEIKVEVPKLGQSLWQRLKELIK